MMTIEQAKQMFQLELEARLERANEQLAERLNGAGWLIELEIERAQLRKAETK